MEGPCFLYADKQQEVEKREYVQKNGLQLRDIQVANAAQPSGRVPIPQGHRKSNDTWACENVVTTCPYPGKPVRRDGLSGHHEKRAWV